MVKSKASILKVKDMTIKRVSPEDAMEIMQKKFSTIKGDNHPAITYWKSEGSRPVANIDVYFATPTEISNADMWYLFTETGMALLTIKNTNSGGLLLKFSNSLSN